MATNTTPIAGVDLSAVQLAADGPRHKAGLRVHGSDGHEYIYASASAAISADTACVLTEPALTMAAGAGDWTSGATAMATGDYGWFQKTAAA
jgi:hypothetical protein